MPRLSADNVTTRVAWISRALRMYHARWVGTTRVACIFSWRMIMVSKRVTLILLECNFAGYMYITFFSSLNGSNFASRRIFVYSVCHISFWCNYKNTSSQYWNGTARLTAQGIPTRCIKYFLCDTGLKTQNFTKNLKVNFSSNVIPKELKFHKLFSFTSSLHVCQ